MRLEEEKAHLERERALEEQREVARVQEEKARLEKERALEEQREKARVEEEKARLERGHALEEQREKARLEEQRAQEARNMVLPEEDSEQAKRKSEALLMLEKELFYSAVTLLRSRGVDGALSLAHRMAKDAVGAAQNALTGVEEPARVKAVAQYVAEEQVERFLETMTLADTQPEGQSPVYNTGPFGLPESVSGRLAREDAMRRWEKEARELMAREEAEQVAAQQLVTKQAPAKTKVRVADV